MNKFCIKVVLIFLLFITQNIKSQIVNIPDPNFKNVLLQGQSGINTNGDDEIQVSEAIAFTGTIDCNSQNIQDLTGIEAFVNLKKLFCYGNSLTNLDLSKNVSLEVLNCFINQLTNLDLTKNVELIEVVCYNNQLQNLNIASCLKLISLGCFGNQLTNLDVSNNVNLERLSCDSNQLTSLDVSNNPALESLECFINQITTLDLSKNFHLKKVLVFGNQLNSLNLKNGQNTLIENFSALYNSNLFCIQVDDSNYSSTNQNWYKDSFATYNTNCNYMAVNESKKDAINFYPNPVTDYLIIKEVPNFIKAEIYSVNGQLLKLSTSKKINLINFSKGNYVIKVYTSENIISRKIIKK